MVLSTTHGNLSLILPTMVKSCMSTGSRKGLEVGELLCLDGSFVRLVLVEAFKISLC